MSVGGGEREREREREESAGPRGHVSRVIFIEWVDTHYFALQAPYRHRSSRGIAAPIATSRYVRTSSACLTRFPTPRLGNPLFSFSASSTTLSGYVYFGNIFRGFRLPVREPSFPIQAIFRCSRRKSCYWQLERGTASIDVNSSGKQMKDIVQ